MIYAHYYKHGKKHMITLSDSPRPTGPTTTFATKTLAKKFAKDNNAKPWNY